MTKRQTLPKTATLIIPLLLVINAGWMKIFLPFHSPEASGTMEPADSQNSHNNIE